MRSEMIRIRDVVMRLPSGGRPLTILDGVTLDVAAGALDPSLLLADEPTGNLDSATGVQIIELLLALNRRRGSTLVLVTHDEALAGQADRVVRLHDGRILNGAS